MAPRPYRMNRRRRGIEETRRRILDATLALHTEKGIFGTSWQDIAERADVSVGTVYKHFPSLDDLVPACGALLAERSEPPVATDAARIVGDATDPAQRVERVADALFAFYERAGPALDIDRRERALPAVREWLEEMEKTIEAFVRVAVAPVRSRREDIRLIGALLDHSTFMAMHRRGIRPGKAAQHVGRLAGLLIDSRT